LTQPTAGALGRGGIGRKEKNEDFPP